MQNIIIVSALPHELDHAPVPHDIPVVFTGIGKLNAALKVSEIIRQYQPEWVINFGTAGRIHAGVSGLVEVADVIQHDMDSEPLAPRGVTPFDDTPSVIASGYPGVRCATGDSFMREVDPWLHDQGVHVVDMELFALALTCQRANVKWRSFKYITDDTDEHAGRDWLDNIHHGRDIFITRLNEIMSSIKATSD